ncbi:hypothetical protein A6A08_21200 [Nocardiopsis sp. TSRI0078]|uniref:pilus assembly protein TadG-related protein n=1 Tax=unclassified Nocardiopsis TaxID=2649073 RepID=UPI0009656C2E|nr:hypothetical protein [Nocardiopsis sp. TSRI0078]OKI21313.1 hypothetical protein A6A08_21200 [Nocardiopsis sp. TSRI0078]
MLLIMLVPVITVVFALVWEGGQMLAAKSELLDIAHSAARSGTHQIDTAATLEQGIPVLDTAAAQQAAIDHLASQGLTGRVLVEEERVAVLARTTYTPSVLPITATPIEAEATATVLQPPAG